MLWNSSSGPSWDGLYLHQCWNRYRSGIFRTHRGDPVPAGEDNKRFRTSQDNKGFPGMLGTHIIEYNSLAGELITSHVNWFISDVPSHSLSGFWG